MAKEGTNVVHEERIQKLCDFLLVRKIKGALERNPARYVSRPARC